MRALIYSTFLVLCFHQIAIAQKVKKPVWTPSDRQALIDGLKTSQAGLIKELEGLNEVQFTFKADTGKWSIKEVTEHLAVYEEYLHWDLVYGIYTPERPELVKQVLGKDEIMLSYENDPNKGQAPWLAKPRGRFSTLADGADCFNSFRNRVVNFVSTTPADLRLHFIYREPDGGAWQVKDLHQQVLLYIAHTRRHTDQIRKVKADKNYPQAGKLWTEADRKYTLDNFKRTREAFVKETEGLTPGQWNFREAPDRWTIGEIVEHLGIWERVWSREINMASRNKPQPELNSKSKPDSFFAEWIMEEKPHNAPDFARPTGLIQGKDNVAFFLKQNDINLKYIETTQTDMRAHFEQTNGDPRSLHHVLIFQWGHIDRHLRQIKKVKASPNYPKGFAG